MICAAAGTQLRRLESRQYLTLPTSQATTGWVRQVNETIGDLFVEQVERHGQAPALRWRVGDEWQTISWERYGDDVRAIALALDARGVHRGSSVAVVAGSMPEYFITDLATAAIGACTASIYQTSTVEQVRYVLENSDSSIVFCDDDAQVAKIAQLRDQVPGLLVVGYTGHDADIAFEALLDEGRVLVASNPGRFDELRTAVEPTDTACVIYTSGTTGQPKAALISHLAILTVLEAVDDAFPVNDDFRVVSYLPLAHIAERVMSLYPQLISGGEVWFSTVNDLKRDLAQCRPTRLLAVPRVWEKFEEALRPKFPDPATLSAEHRAGVLTFLGMDQVTCAISGAAPISVETLKYFASLGIEILEVYGMTESTGLSTANLSGATRAGTVGKAVKGVEVKIADDGEVLIRGALFSGYHKNPQASAEAVRDGWMQSGDLGSIDEDGYLKIIGRKKDLIITAGGENIAPSHIQLLLMRSPYISQALVVGDRRRFLSALITLSEEGLRPWASANGLGELQLAQLAQTPAVRKLVDEAVAAANRQLARVQQVRKYEILARDFTIESGELTPTMKLRRNVVEEDYRDVIETIYA